MMLKLWLWERVGVTQELTHIRIWSKRLSAFPMYHNLTSFLCIPGSPFLHLDTREPAFLLDRRVPDNQPQADDEAGPSIDRFPSMALLEILNPARPKWLAGTLCFAATLVLSGCGAKPPG